MSLQSIQLSAPIKKSLPEGLENDPILKERWEVLPFYVKSENVQKTKDVFALFNQPDKIKPSKLAELPSNIYELSTIIYAIDREFMNSITAYKNGLELAANKDLRLSKERRDTSLDFSNAISTGAVRFAKNTPDILVIKHVVGPALSILGVLYGIIMESSYTQERINMDNSSNREKWLDAVIALEERRIQNARSLIKMRVDVIRREIEEEDQDIIDTNLLEELKALDKLFSAFSFQESFQINNMPVIDYIRHIAPALEGYPNA